MNKKNMKTIRYNNQGFINVSYEAMSMDQSKIV